MAFSGLFQVHFLICLLSSCSCLAGSNELEGVRQGGDGYLTSQLILKTFSYLENDIKDLKAEIADLKSKYEDQPRTIFAQVQLLGTHIYKPRDKVFFTSSVANVGNAYKSHYGYFEAPCDGTYLFSVKLCTAGNNWVVFRIVQDGNILDEGHPGDSSWNACAPSTVVTEMETGSRVWVEMDRIRGGTISSSYGIPSFTGVLLNTYPEP